MAFLRANNGPDSGKKYELSGPLAILGRHPECHIVVDVGAVSRQHCQIVESRNGFEVRDMKSRNGTYVNDTRLDPEESWPLKSGDMVRICDVAFTFLEGSADEKLIDTPANVNTSVDCPSSQVVIDDPDADSASTIMSKFDVSADSQRAQVTATPEVKLKALIDIAHALSNTLSLDEVLPRMLDSLFTIFLQADRGFVVLKNEQGDVIPMWTKVRRENSQQSIRVSRTIIHQVMDTKQAILSQDAASDTRFELSQSVADFRIRSMMCAPLVDGEGDPIGVLQVDTLDQSKRFRNEDLEVLAMIALQAGIAIDNAQMHEEALRQRELQRDLQLAQQVQAGFLPEKPPDIAGYEFHDYYQPAQHVGGDYFDYITLPDGRLAVVVADVVGHGVPAALLMAKLSGEVRFALASETEIAAVMRRINRGYTQLQLHRFVTMILMVLDPKTGLLLMGNAGHPAPLLRHADGTVESIGADAAGIPLGIEEDEPYEQCVGQIDPGDVILMWTDGIHEVCNAKNEQFGIQRMMDVLSNIREPDPTLIGREIIQAVKSFRTDRRDDDDMCLVCFSR